MFARIARVVPAALALLVISSCGTESPTAPTAALLSGTRTAASHISGVRISEIHYDNSGTDTGEAIEISGPAGTDLTGWQLVLYNGANGQSYTPLTTFTGTIPATCDARGVRVTNYAVNGIQNGAPDGVALVDHAGVVVEFLSYEGTFVAANGAANGLTSTDIGVSENGTEGIGNSLQRRPDGTWASSAAHTFGACNDGTTNQEEPTVVTTVDVTPASATINVGSGVQLAAAAYGAGNVGIPNVTFVWTSRDPAVATVNAAGLVTGVAAGAVQVVASAPNGVADSALITVEEVVSLPPVRFSEIHYDNDGTDIGEAIEVEGPTGTNLDGWSIVLYNQTGGVQYATNQLSGVIAEQCSGRGTKFIGYPSNGIQNGAADGFALVNAVGVVVEFLSYEGVLTATDGPAAGMTSTDIGTFEGSTSMAGRSLQRRANGTWTTPIMATFGACFGQTPPPQPNTIIFSGRLATDVPLPVGFEDQVFASLRNNLGETIPTTFTWSSDTPGIASVDANGVMHALSAGSAVLRATAQDGTTGTVTLPTRVATFGGTAAYGNHAEFGEPTDADASDDILVRRETYTASYNPIKNTPNWVSYDLEVSHFGAEDRCDCFTMDPALPAGLTHLTTADYTGAGAAAGYGIDRGHLARSFDRTTGSLDNATTYYFTNIIPQAADNNQGPWSAMEIALGDLARFSNREVYVIAGVAGSKGTLKNEGKVTIPSAVWKVAVVLPKDQGLGNVDSWDDVQVIAAIMPNDPGIRNIDWNTYRTTVDAVEALSGYDLLALLRDDIEIAVESDTRPPVAALDGPWAAYAGDPLAMSGAASSDADGDALTLAWSFGDGANGTGVTQTHTYAAAGSYTVRLIVTDIRGLADTVEAAANITLLPPDVGMARAEGFIDALAAGGALPKGNANSLRVKIDAALKQYANGNLNAVAGQLGAVINEIEAMVRTGALTAAQADPIVEVLKRSLDNLGA